jgi:hypothetical protein
VIYSINLLLKFGSESSQQLVKPVNKGVKVMNNNSYNKYSKGSEWRKWDLHLHTPYTNLNPYKASDEDFINKLKEEFITAVALTNYSITYIDKKVDTLIQD